MEKIELTPILNFLDALTLSKIRNECRSFMTNNTSKIGILNQLKWYFGVYKNQSLKGKITCYLLKVNGKKSGYGLIKKAGGKYWLTGGLTSNARGRGLGKKLFKDLIKLTPAKVVWLEVLENNSVAFNLYKKLGFRSVQKINRRNRKIVLMSLVKNE